MTYNLWLAVILIWRYGSLLKTSLDWNLSQNQRASKMFKNYATKFNCWINIDANPFDKNYSKIITLETYSTSKRGTTPVQMWATHEHISRLFCDVVTNSKRSVTNSYNLQILALLKHKLCWNVFFNMGGYPLPEKKLFYSGTMRLHVLKYKLQIFTNLNNKFINYF